MLTPTADELVQKKKKLITLSSVCERFFFKSGLVLKERKKKNKNDSD